MTSEQIERHVEKRTDRIDAMYMDGKISTSEYETAMRNLSTWADFQYDNASPHNASPND